jgi:hypothetical protein
MISARSKKEYLKTNCQYFKTISGKYEETFSYGMWPAHTPKVSTVRLFYEI